MSSPSPSDLNMQQLALNRSDANRNNNRSNSWLEWLRSPRVWIAGASGVLAVGGLAYYWRRRRTAMHRIQQEQLAATAAAAAQEENNNATDAVGSATERTTIATSSSSSSRARSRDPVSQFLTPPSLQRPNSRSQSPALPSSASAIASAHRLPFSSNPSPVPRLIDMHPTEDGQELSSVLIRAKARKEQRQEKAAADRENGIWAKPDKTPFTPAGQSASSTSVPTTPFSSPAHASSSSSTSSSSRSERSRMDMVHLTPVPQTIQLSMGSFALNRKQSMELLMLTIILLIIVIVMQLDASYLAPISPILLYSLFSVSKESQESHHDTLGDHDSNVASSLSINHPHRTPMRRTIARANEHGPTQGLSFFGYSVRLPTPAYARELPAATPEEDEPRIIDLSAASDDMVIGTGELQMNKVTAMKQTANSSSSSSVGITPMPNSHASTRVTSASLHTPLSIPFPSLATPASILLADRSRAFTPDIDSASPASTAAASSSPLSATSTNASAVASSTSSIAVPKPSIRSSSSKKKKKRTVVVAEDAHGTELMEDVVDVVHPLTVTDDESSSSAALSSSTSTLPTISITSAPPSTTHAQNKQTSAESIYSPPSVEAEISPASADVKPTTNAQPGVSASPPPDASSIAASISPRAASAALPQRHGNVPVASSSNSLINVNAALSRLTPHNIPSSILSPNPHMSMSSATEGGYSSSDTGNASQPGGALSSHSNSEFSEVDRAFFRPDELSDVGSSGLSLALSSATSTSFTIRFTFHHEFHEVLRAFLKMGSRSHESSDEAEVSSDSNTPPRTPTMLTPSHSMQQLLNPNAAASHPVTAFLSPMERNSAVNAVSAATAAAAAASASSSSSSQSSAAPAAFSLSEYVVDVLSDASIPVGGVEGREGLPNNATVSPSSPRVRQMIRRVITPIKLPAMLRKLLGNQNRLHVEERLSFDERSQMMRLQLVNKELSNFLRIYSMQTLSPHPTNAAFTQWTCKYKLYVFNTCGPMKQNVSSWLSSMTKQRQQQISSFLSAMVKKQIQQQIAQQLLQQKEQQEEEAKTQANQGTLKQRTGSHVKRSSADVQRQGSGVGR